MVVDRPADTSHPRFPAVIYPVDYGYLVGTVSGDGEGLDFFRGSATGLGLTAVIFTVDPGKRDVEAKLLIDCSVEEIDAVKSCSRRICAWVFGWCPGTLRTFLERARIACECLICVVR